jgi:hypothetical protein
MKTKDVIVSGRKYQISKMTPLVAVRIHGWLVYVALKFAQGQTQAPPDSVGEAPPANLQEQAEGTVKMLWLMAPSALNEESCEKIQRYALQSCCYYDAATSAPCTLVVNGNFVDKALEEDAVGVSNLITESLVFSISPFFAEGLTKVQRATPQKAN